MLEPEGPMQALLRATLRVGHRGPGCPQHAVGALTRSTLSLGLSLPYPHSWSPLQSPLCPPCCAVSPQCRRGARGLSAFTRGQMVVDRPPAVFQVASDALPESVPMMTSPIAPIRRSRPELPLCPTAGFSFSSVGTPGTV